MSDLIRGEVEFPNRATEDFICVKGNGKPLFALANVVDDRTMAITHVFRGEEHLPNTPKQMMLWWALNEATGSALPLPAFAHLPLLVNEQGKKLSKRRDPVAVEMYREQGYLPSAFRNYLALLGWSPGEEEIVPLATLIERFRIEDVQRSPGLLRHQEDDPYERGLHPRARRPRSSSRCRCPGCIPSRVRGPPATGAIPTPGRASPRGHAGRRSASTPMSSPAWRRWCRNGCPRSGEVPAMVDFLFLEDPPIDPDSWQKAIGRDEVAPADPARRAGGLRHVRVDP